MKTPHSFRPACAGFTLIELLTAIGIIAVLVALLSPALSKMRRSADASQCAANLRQVYGLWWDDVQNNNGEMPPAYNELPYTVAGVDKNIGWLDSTWRGLTANKTKTVGTDKVFGCPAQRKLRKLASNYRTYSMNSNVGNTYWSGTPQAPPATKYLPPIMFSKFQYPGKTMIFCDGAYDVTTPYNSGANGTTRRPETIHDDSANFVFLDGHQERIKAADIPTDFTYTEQTVNLNTPASIFWMGR